MRTHCCGHIVAHDVSWAAQNGKHLLRTQNVSEQNQKHFLCPGHKICVHNKCRARGQTGKHLCRQQCVGLTSSNKSPRQGYPRDSSRPARREGIQEC